MKCIFTLTGFRQRGTFFKQAGAAFGLCVGLALAAPVVQAQTTESYTWSNLAIGGGGFVTGLVTSKTQAGLVYARTDVGGAYRWDVASAKWIPLMDGASDQEQGMFGVESLALDPQNPATVYAYCGISYFNNGRTFIMRSTNYGASWTVMEVTNQFRAHGNGMGRGNGEKLQVDPINSSTLYCGTRTNGLWKSTTSGTTWANLPGLPVSATPNGNGLSFVLVDNASAVGGASQRVFVGVSRNSGMGANFYRSDDAGATFTAVSNPNLAAGQMPQRAVQVDGNLYLSYGDGAGPYGTSFAANGSLPASAEPYGAGQIWKYSIAASTWTNITPAGVSKAFGGISVDPNNASRIIISTTNNYQQQGPTSNSPYGDRFYYTTDGGATWTDVVARGYSVDPNGVSWVPGQSIHWASCIEFDPFVPNRVLVTSGNGVFVNDDITATAGVWKFFVRGLEETVALNLVTIPAGPVISVISDYDGFRHTDVTQYAPIHNPRVGSTSALDFARLSPGKVVRAGYRNAADPSAMFYSADMGVSWTRTTAMNGSGGQVALSADGNVLLHSPDGSPNNVTYRSTNNGTTWTTVTGIPAALTSARPVADAVNASKFYLHNPGNGDLLLSTDSGVSFAVAGNVGGGGGSKIIRAIPGREGHLWVARYGSGLARSVNSGGMFTVIPGVTYCGAVGYGKAATTGGYESIYIYGVVGGVVGVYRSNDQGASWVRVNDDAHEFGGPANGQFVMGDVNIYGRVYMSTAGRGIMYAMPTAIGLGTRPGRSSWTSLQAYPNPTAGTVTLSLPKELVGGRVSVLDALGVVMRSEAASHADWVVDLRVLPVGLYTVQVVLGQYRAVARVVKE